MSFCTGSMETPYTKHIGEHMPGGIDPVLGAFWWQQYRIIVLSELKLMDLPTEKVSGMAVPTLMDEFKGAWERKRAGSKMVHRDYNDLVAIGSVRCVVAVSSIFHILW